MKKLLVLGILFAFLAPARAAEPPIPKKIGDLVKNLKSKDPATQLAAVTALADLGPKAKEAIPDLVNLLKVKNEDLRLNSSIALGKIGKAAVADLVKALRDKDPDTRYYAVWALGWIGPDARAGLDRSRRQGGRSEYHSGPERQERKRAPKGGFRAGSNRTQGRGRRACPDQGIRGQRFGRISGSRRWRGRVW
jgi:hypothetical protein